MGDYAFTITSSEGEEIKIGYEGEDDSVQGISVCIDTLDNNVSQKSSAMLARVTINGAVTDSNRDSLKSIFDWSKEIAKANAYRKITIECKGPELNTPRTYELDQVFVCDYSETAGVVKEGEHAGTQRLTYEIRLTQFQSKWSGVKIY